MPTPQPTLDRTSTPALQDFTPLGRAPQPALRALGLDAFCRYRGEALLRAVPVAAAELAGTDPPLVHVSLVVDFVRVGLFRVVMPGFDGWAIGTVVGWADGGGERAHWCEDEDNVGESHVWKCDFFQGVVCTGQVGLNRRREIDTLDGGARAGGNVTVVEWRIAKFGVANVVWDAFI